MRDRCNVNSMHLILASIHWAFQMDEKMGQAFDTVLSSPSLGGAQRSVPLRPTSGADENETALQAAAAGHPGQPINLR